MAGYYDEETGEFIDTGDVGVNQYELDNTSGTGEIGDYAEEYDMAAFDAATESYLKENYPELAADATTATKAAAAFRKLGAGAFNLLPVASLYFFRPLAVNPAPFDTGSFSPRPTDRLGFFFIYFPCVLTYFLAISTNETCPSVARSISIIVSGPTHFLPEQT